jgi:hypothetical protein
MAVVTIPFDYETGRYRRGLIPICISDTDECGQQIEWRWFEAAAKMADYMRGLARIRLGDVWRVSVLAELSLRANGRNHAGEDVRRPDRLVAAYCPVVARDPACDALKTAVVVSIPGHLFALRTKKGAHYCPLKPLSKV